MTEKQAELFDQNTASLILPIMLHTALRVKKRSFIMTGLISRTIAHINSLLKEVQLKRFLAATLVGFLLLTTNVKPEGNNKALTQEVRDLVHQNDSDRPKTVGEWKQEARETKHSPGERAQRIGKESAEAVKDFGSLYPDTAKRSASDLRN
ncbi:hypothetical protein K9N68_00560 [Kovacikia minuta CCNUW1]|uniref:hypothetical protein n=1 Tax=Kovacikia minuta TaxID=2931930 RepID=UPI001CCEA1A7|nr:hypothetical protein [Kovacikia minuta]UBF26540.1 hypothetical protein K9N68_00560 [Kovacikia minuta CCNUW1]